MKKCIMCGAEVLILKLCRDCYEAETQFLTERAQEAIEDEEYEDDYIHYSKYRNP